VYGLYSSLISWCFPVFNPPQVLADRVVWSAQQLYPGTHSVIYSAVAITQGALLCRLLVVVVLVSVVLPSLLLT
jgi:hypothetical protein